MNQTAPLKLSETEIEERYNLLRASQPEGIELSDLQPARMADVCYINYIDEDGLPQWKVITITGWKELGGRIE